MHIQHFRTIWRWVVDEGATIQSFFRSKYPYRRSTNACHSITRCDFSMALVWLMAIFYMLSKNSGQELETNVTYSWRWLILRC